MTGNNSPVAMGGGGGGVLLYYLEQCVMTGIPCSRGGGGGCTLALSGTGGMLNLVIILHSQLLTIIGPLSRVITFFEGGMFRQGTNPL